MKNPEFEVGKFYECFRQDEDGIGVVGLKYKFLGLDDDFKYCQVGRFLGSDGVYIWILIDNNDKKGSALFVEAEDPEQKKNSEPMLIGIDWASSNEVMMDRDGTDREDRFDKPPKKPLTYAPNEKKRIEYEELDKRRKGVRHR